MNTTKEQLPAFMTQESGLNNEISITGKWVPKQKGGIFRKSKDSKEMLKEWEDIHSETKAHEGMLSTEINHAVGQDAVLVHHVFEDEKSLLGYFNQTASTHKEALTKVAKPEAHLIRGAKISENMEKAMLSKGVKGDFASYLFGYIKNDNVRPNPETAIQVTAKWTCKDGESVEDLIYWWQKVGTEAYDLEKGLVRFEVYKVIGEEALIIHETFDTSDELQFHLSKGTAHQFKNDIDQIAYPKNYFFRGPVSWTIRTYSKFMRLPATYSSQGSRYTKEGGNNSDGFSLSFNRNNNLKSNEMNNQEISVTYRWTAKEGKSEELKAIYQQVTKDMQANEPGALKVECYFEESSRTLVVYDLFSDAGALGFHLGTTAGAHFPQLLEVATPGAFLFCGDVPKEMQEAALGMGLEATFAPSQFGFTRELVS